MTPDLSSQLSAFTKACQSVTIDGLAETTNGIQQTLERYLAAAHEQLAGPEGQTTRGLTELSAALRATADAVASNLEFLVKNNVNGAGQPRW